VSSESSCALRLARHSQNAWARHVECVESSRVESSQVEFEPNSVKCPCIVIYYYDLCTLNNNNYYYYMMTLRQYFLNTFLLPYEIILFLRLDTYGIYIYGMVSTF